MPRLSRRGMFAASAALAVPVAVVAALEPDADFIRVCEAHPTLLETVNKHGSGRDNCPHWQAYERSRDVITQTAPETLAGVIAKARAAKREGWDTESGYYSPDGTFAVTWALDLLDDFLRLSHAA